MVLLNRLLPTFKCIETGPADGTGDLSSVTLVVEAAEPIPIVVGTLHNGSVVLLRVQGEAGRQAFVVHHADAAGPAEATEGCIVWSDCSCWQIDQGIRQGVACETDRSFWGIADVGRRIAGGRHDHQLFRIFVATGAIFVNTTELSRS